jgi:ParB/RepB/Spo0J family partition protein
LSQIAAKLVREESRTPINSVKEAMPWIELALGNFLRAQAGQSVSFGWRKLHYFMRAHPETYPPINEEDPDHGNIYGNCLSKLAEVGLIARVTPLNQDRSNGGILYTITERGKSILDCGNAKLLFVPLEKIDPPKYMMRRSLGSLCRLMMSIKRNGLLVPPTVRPLPNGRFEIVDGHRRVQACLNLGYVTQILCSVRELDDLSSVLVGLAQNIEREQMSPIEIGEAYKYLRSKGLSVPEIAQETGKQAEHVLDHLKLLGLSDEEQKLVHVGKLSMEKALKYLKARKLLGEERGDRFVSKALSMGLTPNQTEEAIELQAKNPDQSEDEILEKVLDKEKYLSLGYHPERGVFVVATRKSSFRFECLKCHQQYEIDWDEGYVQTRQATLSEFSV